MKAEVIALNFSLPTCSARTKTDILVVFKPPVSPKIEIGDILDVDLLTLDRIQKAENLTQRLHLDIEIKSHDMHDLRLASAHGVSRTPSLERRNENGA